MVILKIKRENNSKIIKTNADIRDNNFSIAIYNPKRIWKWDNKLNKKMKH